MKFHAKPDVLTHGGEQFTLVSISYGTQEAILERRSDPTRIRLPSHELTHEIICCRTRLLDKGGNRGR
jgi:hypothetical protein